MRYQNLLARVYNQPHLIRPEKLEAIRQVVTNRALGVQADGGTVEAMMAAAESRRQPQVTRSVAVLPIVGTLAKRMDLLEESSGGMSTDRIGKEFDRLLADESVGAIVLDVDSPGGESFGVQELAAKIFAARGTKPITAVANPEAASAALWIATAADSFSVTPSGWVGSLGVYMAHTDLTGMYEMMGGKVSYIVAGGSPYKVDGAPEVPLTDEARGHFQGIVDAVFNQFVADVAKHRGVTVAEARANYGQGRMLLAKDAKAAGLVDRIETLDEAISRAAGVKRQKGAKGENLRRRLELRKLA